jgi:hypothetical protein
MNGGPGVPGTAARRWEQDSAQAERERHERSMRRMDELIRWLDRHEHWWLREQRWRAEGRAR